MIVMIVAISLLHSHVTLEHRVKAQQFPFVEACLQYGKDNGRSLQALADRLFNEKTKVQLVCMPSPDRKA